MKWRREKWNEEEKEQEEEEKEKEEQVDQAGKYEIFSDSLLC